jgi:hypothetical protein
MVAGPLQSCAASYFDILHQLPVEFVCGIRNNGNAVYSKGREEENTLQRDCNSTLEHKPKHKKKEITLFWYETIRSLV